MTKISLYFLEGKDRLGKIVVDNDGEPTVVPDLIINKEIFDVVLSRFALCAKKTKQLQIETRDRNDDDNDDHETYNLFDHVMYRWFKASNVNVNFLTFKEEAQAYQKYVENEVSTEKDLANAILDNDLKIRISIVTNVRFPMFASYEQIIRSAGHFQYPEYGGQREIEGLTLINLILSDIEDHYTATATAAKN